MANEPVAPADAPAASITGGHGETTASVEVADSAGMPQLDFGAFPNQIFWLVLALVAIYLILSRSALPRIAGVLSERQGAITGDLAKAEDLRQQASDAEAAYDKALADARTEAQAIVAKTRADIQKDLDAAIAEADAEIGERTREGEAQIAAIRAEADGSVAEVARDTAAALLDALGVDADRAAVDAAVAQRMGARR